MDFRTQIEHQSFGVRATALIIRDGKIYLAKTPKGRFYCIGGALHFGETSEEAVKREVREEVDMEVQVEKLAFVAENQFTIGNRDFHQFEFHYLVTPITEPNPQMNENGRMRECEWVPLSDLEKIHLEPSFLQTALQDLKQPLQHIINID